MVYGKVKWFNNKKGYGFITDSDNNDHFVHFSNVAKDYQHNIRENDEVTFDIAEGKKGPHAVNVELVSHLDEN